MRDANLSIPIFPFLINLFHPLGPLFSGTAGFVLLSARRSDGLVFVVAQTGRPDPPDSFSEPAGTDPRQHKATQPGAGGQLGLGE